LFFLAIDIQMISLSHAVEVKVEASKIDLKRNDHFSVDIVIDQAKSIAGCTFTFYYPDEVLEVDVPAVTSNFFKLFLDDRPGADPSEILPWAANLSENGGIILSGAYVCPDTGTGAYTGEQTLFTLYFHVKQDAHLGPFSIELAQTMLCNGPAGWGNDANNNGQYDPGDQHEPAPILFKANAIGSANEFEIALNSFVRNPLQMLKVSGASDIDGDGVSNAVEDVCCTFSSDPDTDNDGIWDGVEDKDGDCFLDPGETDPCNWDSDGDSLADGDEDLNQNGVREAGELNPLNEDTDYDGYGDGLERSLGTNPLNSALYPYLVCVGTCDALCDACTSNIANALSIVSHDAQINYIKVRGEIIYDVNATLAEKVLVGIESGCIILKK
jgi:hypothetical protein